MADFVELSTFVAHIRLPESQMSLQLDDVQAKLDSAEAIVLKLLNTTAFRRLETATWTADTVPWPVKEMILRQGAYLWQFRGDEPKEQDNDGLAPGVKQLSWFYRDPVVAWMTDRRMTTVARVTAGDRSHLVTIQAPAGTLLDTDSDVETNVPAAIQAWPIGSQLREQLIGGGVQHQSGYTVNINYRLDVKASYVLLEQCCTERRLQIVSIAPTDRRDSLDMTCLTAS